MILQVKFEKEKSNDLLAFCEHSYSSIKHWSLFYRMNIYFNGFLILLLHLTLVGGSSIYNQATTTRLCSHPDASLLFFGCEQCMLWSMLAHF